jgi:cytochrome c556
MLDRSKLAGSKLLGGILAAVTGLGLAGACAPRSERHPAEVRQSVPVTALERQEILAEMRAMMVAVEGITRGLATGDAEAVVLSARSSAMPGALSAASLPEPFRAIGMRTHGALEVLARETAAGATGFQGLNHLSSITGNCVGCHASYRLTVAYAPDPRFGPPPTF